MGGIDVPNGSKMLCLFRCGTRAVAVPLESVREVVRVDGLVRLPLAPPGVVGLCMLRRDVIPVVTLGGPGAGARAGLDGKGPIVVFQAEAGGAWGVPIEEEGVVLADDPRPDSDRLGPGAATGTVRLAGADYELLDGSAIWREIRGGSSPLQPRGRR